MGKERSDEELKEYLINTVEERIDEWYLNKAAKRAVKDCLPNNFNQELFNYR